MDHSSMKPNDEFAHLFASQQLILSETLSPPSNTSLSIPAKNVIENGMDSGRVASICSNDAFEPLLISYADLVFDDVLNGRDNNMEVPHSVVKARRNSMGVVHSIISDDELSDEDEEESLGEVLDELDDNFPDLQEGDYHDSFCTTQSLNTKKRSLLLLKRTLLSSQKSQIHIQNFDQLVGLKRCHSRTMCKSALSRKKVMAEVKRQLSSSCRK